MLLTLLHDPTLHDGELHTTPRAWVDDIIVAWASLLAAERGLRQLSEALREYNLRFNDKTQWLGVRLPPPPLANTDPSSSKGSP